jgi:cell division protein FtsL
MSIRDLNMQIEIANAQKTEFEEASQQLRQDIKDLGKIETNILLQFIIMYALLYVSILSCLYTKFFQIFICS